MWSALPNNACDEAGRGEVTISREAVSQDLDSRSLSSTPMLFPRRALHHFPFTPPGGPWSPNVCSIQFHLPLEVSIAAAASDFFVRKW